MTLAIIIIAVIAAAIIGYIGYTTNLKKHTGGLKGRFGPEYDRPIAESSGRKQAEQDLAARQKQGAASEREASGAARLSEPESND